MGPNDNLSEDGSSEGFDTEMIGEDEDFSKVEVVPQKTDCDIRRERTSARIKLRAKVNIWEYCCAEVKEEMQELDAILSQMGFPCHNYNKDKTFRVTDYTEAPDIQHCSSKDYLDFYVFPYLLPAIQAMILFARQNHIFQCRISTFNPADFISEYLYNSNPRHPNRQDNPIPLFETTFAKSWLRKYPRPPLPKWLTMSEDEAACIIQRAVRGFLVRKREDVQEMRQFWRELQKDREEERNSLKRTKEQFQAVYYRSEITDEDILFVPNPKEPVSPLVKSHSQECEICARFNQLLQAENDSLTKAERNVATPTSKAMASNNKGTADEKTLQQLTETFAMEHNKCCFYPGGHLPFTPKPTSKDKFRPHPSLSCIKQPRRIESKGGQIKVLPLNHPTNPPPPTAVEDEQRSDSNPDLEKSLSTSHSSTTITSANQDRNTKKEKTIEKKVSKTMRSTNFKSTTLKKSHSPRKKKDASKDASKNASKNTSKDTSKDNNVK